MAPPVWFPGRPRQVQTTPEVWKDGFIWSLWSLIGNGNIMLVLLQASRILLNIVLSSAQPLAWHRAAPRAVGGVGFILTAPVCWLTALGGGAFCYLSGGGWKEPKCKGRLISVFLFISIMGTPPNPKPQAQTQTPVPQYGVCQDSYIL